VRWISQSCVWHRLLIQAGCMVLILYGLKLASGHDPAAPIINVAGKGISAVRA
jgi:hypothetical protein